MGKRWKPRVYVGGRCGDGRARGPLVDVSIRMDTPKSIPMFDSSVVEPIFFHESGAVPKPAHALLSRSRVMVRAVRGTWWKGYFDLSVTLSKAIYEVYSMFFRSVHYILMDSHAPVPCTIESYTMVSGIVVLRIRSEPWSWRAYFGMRTLFKKVVREQRYVPYRLELCNEVSTTTVPII